MQRPVSGQLAGPGGGSGMTIPLFDACSLQRPGTAQKYSNVLCPAPPASQFGTKKLVPAACPQPAAQPRPERTRLDARRWCLQIRTPRSSPTFSAGSGVGLHPARKYQPSTGAVKGSKILWPRPLSTHINLGRTQPLHGQSILEVLRTRPLTAPAPGSDRRLSGEAHHVGGHSHRSDHEPHGSLPGMQRRRPGARTGMHMRRQRAHLHAHDLHRVHGQRRARCVPDRKVIGGQSRSPADTPYRPSPAAGHVRKPGERSLQAGGHISDRRLENLRCDELGFRRSYRLRRCDGQAF
jgi:hypothetical protein